MKVTKLIPTLVCLLAVFCLFSGCVTENTPPANEMVIAEDVADWDRIISQTDNIIIAKLWADWCPDCQNVSQAYEEMPAKYPNITFVEFDIEGNDGENKLLIQRYNVKSIPQFMVFQNGMRVNTTGLVTEGDAEQCEEMEQYIEKIASGNIFRGMTTATYKNWDFIISEPGLPILAFFYTDGCADCQELKPVFEELPEKYPNIHFVKYNLNDGDNAMLASRYGITKVPEFKLFVDGEQIDTANPSTPEELERHIEYLINEKLQ